MLFGLALGVKHNAWLMPFFLVAALPLDEARGLARASAAAGPAGVRLDAGARARLIFFSHWPWLWAAPIARTRAYVLRHLEHEHYNFEYLGRNFNQPPTTAATQVAARHRSLRRDGLDGPGHHAGACRRRRGRPGPAPARRARPSRGRAAEGPVDRRPSWLRPGADVDRAPGAFVFFQTLGPLAVLAVPSTPMFGGVKHFLAAMPYLALSAGRRPRRAAARGARRPGRPLARWRPTCGARWRWRRLVCLPGARRDAPLAPGRPRALQPSGGRLRRRGVAGHEPPVLGIRGAARCSRTSTRVRRRTARSTGTTCSRTRSRCTNATGGCRWRSGTPASARTASAFAAGDPLL